MQGPFCDINIGVNGKFHYKLFSKVLSNRCDFFREPVLQHISVEAPTIRNEKDSMQLKEKFSEMVKVYYWLSKGGNFDAKQFKQPAKS